MMPEHCRVLRRERRKAWRGIPGGRKATRQVETAYGRKQRERDRHAAFLAARAAQAEPPF